MRRALAVLGWLAAGAGLLMAWPVTDTYVGLNFPDPTEHVQTLARPITVTGWCWNESTAIDYYEIWLVHDADGDGVVDQGEYDTLVVVRRQEDFNLPDRTSQRLTPRYAINAENTTDSEKYFVFVYAVDLDGNVSTDTDIVGAEPDGTGLITAPGVVADEVIAYFTLEGIRP